jgi:multidrug efflux pump subunit AcrA (membrane-fusion protein)
VGNAKDIVRISQQLRTRITWGSRQGPVVPVLAVTRINGQFFVFVAMKEDNSTVARQKVLKLGEIIGNNYAVLDGLKPGEHLIISGTQFLQDGMPVAEQIAQAADGSTGKTEPGATAN